MTDDCPQCDGHRFVCERHPDEPWPHPTCVGAGVPCRLCQDGDAPMVPPDFPSRLKPSEN